MALCPGLPGWAGTSEWVSEQFLNGTSAQNRPFQCQAGTRKVKPIWILLKQETVSGSGISWDIRKSAPRSRQITMPAPHSPVFTGRMPFLPPNQQCQSTENKFQSKLRHKASCCSTDSNRPHRCCQLANTLAHDRYSLYTSMGREKVCRQKGTETV